MKKIILLLAAGLMVSAIIIGCSTEEPWEPDPTRLLELVIVSAPDASTEIPHNSNVSFSWSAKGGSGKILGYEWYLEPAESDWGTRVNVTSVTYDSLPGDVGGESYTFHVRVTDDANNTATVARAFVVAEAVPPEPDTTAPAVTITQSPAEGSYVAVGTSVKFAWEGDDGHGNNDMIEYQYAFPVIDSFSEWIEATTVTFADVAANDPAIFYVRGRDQDDNTSDWDSVTFVIQPATILYVDDFLWLDLNGNPDMPKERDQKQFYRDVLEGYAFAEWDIALQGMPDSSYLVDVGNPVFTSIVWCSDADLGSPDGTWWYDIGEVNGGVLRYYMEAGGNLLVSGPSILQWICNNVPPLAGDFEFDWLGVDSSGAWDYWWWLTWVMKDTSTTLDLPDSIKVDVAKNGDQDDYAEETPYLRNDAGATSEVIFTWGLWVDGSEPAPYGSPVGHVTTFVTGQKSAMLNFSTYVMPKPEMRQTFHTILAEFGE
jgi:hypothetical protein